MIINLSDLILEVKQSVDIDEKTIDNIIREFMIALKGSLAEGHEVRIANFGSFTVKKAYNRRASLPNTAALLVNNRNEVVPPSVVFSPYVPLKRLLQTNPDLTTPLAKED